MIRVKENAKPQCWYEETETGYQVCVRKPHNDYFRTEYIKCHTKDEAKELVTTIKENGYTNISNEELKECTNDCTEPINKNFSFGDDDFINKQEETKETEPKEEKPRAKFEFDDDEIKFRKEMDRLRDMPIEVKETGTSTKKIDNAIF